MTEEERPSVAVAPSVILGFCLTLVAMGLPMIGVTVNVYLGASILVVAFILLAYGLWHFEKARRWSEAARVSSLWILGIICFALVGAQVYSQYKRDHSSPRNDATITEHGHNTTANNNPPLATPMKPSDTPVPPALRPKTDRPKPKAAAPAKPTSPPSAQPVPGPGSLVQNNSGGVNVQQGTTGINSPIINSPITIGDTPKAITPVDMANVVRFLQQPKSPVTIVVTADQYSGPAPFPDDFYDAFKSAGWMMRDAGVSRMMVFTPPGKQFQGAVVTEKGEPLKPGEVASFLPTAPERFIAALLDAYKIPRVLVRRSDQPDNQITVGFMGGFPK